MDDITTVLGNLFNAAKGGQYLLAGAILVIFVVGMLKKYAATTSWLAFMSKGKWAWTSAIVMGALLAVAMPIAAGHALGGVGGVAVLLLNGAIAGLTGAGLVKGFNEHTADTPTVPSPPAEQNSTK